MGPSSPASPAHLPTSRESLPGAPGTSTPGAALPWFSKLPAASWPGLALAHPHPPTPPPSSLVGGEERPASKGLCEAFVAGETLEPSALLSPHSLTARLLTLACPLDVTQAFWILWLWKEAAEA